MRLFLFLLILFALSYSVDGCWKTQTNEQNIDTNYWDRKMCSMPKYWHLDKCKRLI